MKRMLPVLVIFLFGCVDQVVVINHHYRADGYTVRGFHGIWVYSEKKKTATLTFGEGFDERIYVDADGDYAVDRVKDTYRRGQEGSEDVFRRADEDFDVARKRYDMDAEDKKWRAMTPDERARLQDYQK